MSTNNPLESAGSVALDPIENHNVDIERQLCPRCSRDVDWDQSKWCLECGYCPRYDGAAEPSQKFEKQSLPWETEASFKLPPWGVVMALGVLALLGESAYVGYAHHEQVHLRAVWSIVQIVIGMLLLTAAQISAFLHASMFDGEKVGLFDFMMKPLGIWYSTIKVLPQRAWSMWLGAWGATAILAAVLLVGGIRYSAIFDDWGFVPHAAPNLVHKIVEQAREAEGEAESMEEAMNEFVGEGETVAEEKKNWVTIDCLIVGYTPLADGDFASLLLATTVKNRLKYIGLIPAERIPEGVRKKLLVRMRQLEAFRPILKVSQAGIWVKPRLMCRVKEIDWTEAKPDLHAVEFDALLSELPGK
ncbi:MAG: hypothetical protein ACKVT0_12705 [Planctomycetaceae bacterium]